MPELQHLVHFTPEVRAAVLCRFKWFVHSTPDRNLDSIRQDGILANRDVTPSSRMIAAGANEHRISCFVPLGSRLSPKPAYNTGPVLPMGAPDPYFVSLAVEDQNMPMRLGIDWSYYGNEAERLVDREPDLTSEAAALRLLHECGSVVSYDAALPSSVRIFCIGNPPLDPLAWPCILDAPNDAVVRHTLG
jgi:hypothetical protein